MPTAWPSIGIRPNRRNLSLTPVRRRRYLGVALRREQDQQTDEVLAADRQESLSSEQANRPRHEAGANP